MAKKAKPVNEEKEFLAKCKLFFSSLTARSAQYAYFNMAPNLVVVSNSTSPPPNEDHGDRLMDYSVGELSFHFIEFKDEEFLNKLRSFLKIPDGVYFCVHVLNLLSVMGKFAQKDLEVFNNEYGETIVVNKGRSTYDKKNIVGFVIDNFHIVSELYKWYQFVYGIGTDEHKKKYPYVSVPMNTSPEMTGRVFFTEINTTLFKDEQGNPVFKDVMPSMKILCLDGLTTVSIKEFVKRISNLPYTLMLYMWVVDNSYVLSMTIFENDMVKVRSIRPNVLATPISNNIIIESANLTSLSEDFYE